MIQRGCERPLRQPQESEDKDREDAFINVCLAIADTRDGYDSSCGISRDAYQAVFSPIRRRMKNKQTKRDVHCMRSVDCVPYARNRIAIMYNAVGTSLRARMGVRGGQPKRS